MYLLISILSTNSARGARAERRDGQKSIQSMAESLLCFPCCIGGQPQPVSVMKSYIVIDQKLRSGKVANLIIVCGRKCREETKKNWIVDFGD